MLLAIALGLIPGLSACFTIKKYEKKDASYGRLEIRQGMLLVISGLFATFSAVYTVGTDAECILSALVNIWMLLVTSYMDMRSGQFHVAVLIPAVTVQVIMITASLFRGTSSLYTGKNGSYLLLFMVLLLIFKLAGLAGGDCIIYLSCGLSFLILCGDYFPLAFCVTLLFSHVAGLLFHIKGLTNKESWKKDFPFTVYIAAGCFVSYFIFVFLGK